MSIRKWIILFGLAVLITACLIFMFSAQDGDASSETSIGLTNLLLRVFYPDYASMPFAQRRTLLNAWNNGVRKAAHFTEFAVLGLFLRLLFQALKFRKKTPLAWLAGTLYACTDEWHQMYVDQRAASWLDVIIDSAGVLFGVFLALLILRLWKNDPSDAKAGSEPRLKA